MLKLQKQLTTLPDPEPTTAKGAKKPKRSRKTDTAKILEDDLRKRLALRDTLEDLLEKAKQKNDSVAAARIANQLLASLDGLRRVVTVNHITGDDPALKEAAANRVRERLERIRNRKGPVLEPTVEPDEPVAPNGTEPG